MIRIEIDAKDTLVMLRGLEHAVTNFEPVWLQVEKIIIEMLKARFTSEGKYPREPWVPLNPAYARWKATNYPGKGILRARDRLYGSLTDPGHELHVYAQGPSFMETGTSDPIGGFHQRGTSRLPQRKIFVEVSKEEGERIGDVILAYLIHAMRKELR